MEDRFWGDTDANGDALVDPFVGAGESLLRLLALSLGIRIRVFLQLRKPIYFDC